MKSPAAFAIGLAAGFWLMELGLAGRSTGLTDPATAAQPPPATATASVAAPVPAPAQTETAPAVTLWPEREKPNAFFIQFAYSLPSVARLPEEERADPDFVELHRRAILAHARDRMAPFVPALGLSPAQFATLLEVSIDQALAWRQRSEGPMTARQENAIRGELSRTAEARLAAVLTPGQMNTLASFGMTSSTIGRTAEAFAERGAPLSFDQVGRLLKLRPAAIRPGIYDDQPLDWPEPDPRLEGMTDAQRRYETARLRWQEASMLKYYMRNVQVKDPELREMWP